MTGKELSDFIVTEDIPTHLVKSPTFLTGVFGQAVFDAHQKERESTYHNNPNLKLRLQGDVVTESTFFDTVLVNKILRTAGIQGNPRTTSLVDLSNPEIMNMAEGKHYVDAQALVLRSTTDPAYKGNNPLIKALAKHVDVKRLAKEPALLQGFDLKLDQLEKGYGLLVVPSTDFTVYHDDRLAKKWSGFKFDNVDEIGLPVNLDKSKGSRIWFTHSKGLSRLVLDGDLDLGAGWSTLGSSCTNGRVVVVSGEATAPAERVHEDTGK